MVNKLIFILLISFILISPFISSENELFNEKYDLNTLLNDKPKINEKLENEEIIIPSPINSLFKNGNVFFNISLIEGGYEYLYVVIEKNRILKVIEGLPEKSNYVVFSDEETLNGIMNSQDIPKEAFSEYKNKKIKIKANGFSNKLKLFFGKIALKFVK